MFNPRRASFQLPCATSCRCFNFFLVSSVTQEQAEGWKDGDEARQTQKIAERPLHGYGFGFSLSELVR